MLNVVRQHAKELGFESQRRKSDDHRAKMEFVFIFHRLVYLMLNYACVCCVRLVFINSLHYGKRGANARAKLYICYSLLQFRHPTDRRIAR